MDAAVPGIEELLAVNSDLRRQVKQDADLILALQLQLQEKDEAFSRLRQSCLAAADSAPLMEGQCFTFVSKGDSDSTASFASPRRKLTKEENRFTYMHTSSSHSSVNVDESGIKMNDIRHVLISARSSAVAPLQGLNFVMMEGNDGLSTAPGAGSIQHIPFLLLRDIFLHFDVCTKFRLQRVDSSWKAELDTVRLEQRVQFVDFPEYLRHIVRANCRGKDDQNRDDDSLIRSWLSYDGLFFQSRYTTVCKKVRSVADKYSTTKKGTVVIKLHDGFDYDSYVAGKYWETCGASLPYHLMQDTLGFRKANRVVFVDSVLSESCLNELSAGQRKWHSIGLIRTTIYADDICQHLMQPLYITHHLVAVNRKRCQAFWTHLLDTYSRLSTTESLSLLRQHLVKLCEKRGDDYFNLKLAGLYENYGRSWSRDDLRNRDLAFVDLSKLYPSTIYALATKLHPLWRFPWSLGPQKRSPRDTCCLQRRSPRGTCCLQCARLEE